MPHKLIKALPLLALAAALAGCGVGSQQTAGNTTTAPPPATVLLSVNGEAVTVAELNAYIDLATAGDPVVKYRITAEQRYELAREVMRATIAAQEAAKLGLTKKPDVQAALAVNRLLYLAGKAAEYFQHTAKVPESVLQRKYRERVKDLNGNEYKLRRMTLKSKADANKIVSRLESGGSFAALAKKHSSDDAAKRGGDIGWFKQKALQQSQPDVAKAIAQLKKGAYTKAPIQTTSGWLVIELEDKTTVTAPDLAALKPMLEKEIKQEMTERYLKKLESTADIHWYIPKPLSAATAATH
ncbi:MAG: peptidylprolyl isomerase [Gammaproteobacteria bacterium]